MEVPVYTSLRCTYSETVSLAHTLIKVLEPNATFSVHMQALVQSGSYAKSPQQSSCLAVASKSGTRPELSEGYFLYAEKKNFFEACFVKDG